MSIRTVDQSKFNDEKRKRVNGSFSPAVTSITRFWKYHAHSFSCYEAHESNVSVLGRWCHDTGYFANPPSEYPSEVLRTVVQLQKLFKTAKWQYMILRIDQRFLQTECRFSHPIRYVSVLLILRPLAPGHIAATARRCKMLSCISYNTLMQTGCSHYVTLFEIRQDEIVQVLNQVL